MVYRKAWEVDYQRDRAAGRLRYVEAEPTRLRLAELAAAHVPLRALSRATGLSDTGVKAILEGSRSHVQSSTAARVESLSLRTLYSTQATGHVPRVGAVRRVQALMALGWSHRELERAGVPNTARLLSGTGHLVTIERWREVCDVYDKLSMTLGPSPETRGWAKSLGYPPPLAWDEDAIDDPGARPHHRDGESGRTPIVDPVAVRRAVEHAGRAGPLTSAERTEAAHTMSRRGHSDSQIADRLGVSDRTVLRWRQRSGSSALRPPAAAHEWSDALAATRRPAHPRGATPTVRPAVTTDRSITR
jgi:hypothetical protein